MFSEFTKHQVAFENALAKRCGGMTTEFTAELCDCVWRDILQSATADESEIDYDACFFAVYLWLVRKRLELPAERRWKGIGNDCNRKIH